MSACRVVMYHYVRDIELTPFPQIKALSTADFRKQLDWLQETHDVIDFPAFEQALRGERLFERPTALLTFDDGFIDHFAAVFPILRERGLRGVFFVPDATMANEPFLLNVHRIHFLLARLGAEAFAEEVQQGLSHVALDHRDRKGIYRYDERADHDVKRLLNYELPYELADALLDDLFRRHLGDPAPFARDLYLNPPMIRAMAMDGQTFGGHTKNHRVLSRLTEEEQRQELADAVALLKELTGQPSIPFCYPYGHPHTYDAATLRLLPALGYSCAFNTVRVPVDFTACVPFELPRFDTKDLPPFTSGAFS